MRMLLALGLFLVSAGAYAACDLGRPAVRQMVLKSLQTRTDADLSKAYWINVFKSDTYSVFMVQFKRPDDAGHDDRIHTLTTVVTCDPTGSPSVGASADWSVRVSDFANL